MKTTPKTSALSGPVFAGILAGLLLTLPAPPTHADDELRAGAVLQIPFDLSARGSFFDPTAIRIGLTCQYADVEEEVVTVTHHVTNTYMDGNPTGSTETWNVSVDEGDRVYGLEGNLFVEVFNRWNLSAELLGFYGNNDIQGALGAGYSLANDFFLDAKVMFPYSEVGLRFLNGLEIYGGGKTLGDFNPEKEHHRINMVTTNTTTNNTVTTTTIIN